MSILELPEKIDRAATLRQFEKDRCEDDLSYFIRKAWPLIEPSNPYVEGWHIKLVAMHLEAITNGEVIDGNLYNRLLINVPPGTMKSLLVNVFWPAWEWGPKGNAWAEISFDIAQGRIAHPMGGKDEENHYF